MGLFDASISFHVDGFQEMQRIDQATGGFIYADQGPAAVCCWRERREDGPVWFVGTRLDTVPPDDGFVIQAKLAKVDHSFFLGNPGLRERIIDQIRIHYVIEPC